VILCFFHGEFRGFPLFSSELRCLVKGSAHDELNDETAVAAGSVDVAAADVAAVVDDVADGT